MARGVPSFFIYLSIQLHIIYLCSNTLICILRMNMKKFKETSNRASRFNLAGNGVDAAIDRFEHALNNPSTAYTGIRSMLMDDYLDSLMRMQKEQHNVDSKPESEHTNKDS